MMQQALQRVSQSSSQPLPEGKVACRAAYRLAHYADSMYCSVQKQRNSPEWATAQAVIQQKMQQVCLEEGTIYDSEWPLARVTNCPWFDLA